MTGISLKTRSQLFHPLETKSKRKRLHQCQNLIIGTVESKNALARLLPEERGYHHPQLWALLNRLDTHLVRLRAHLEIALRPLLWQISLNKRRLSRILSMSLTINSSYPFLDEWARWKRKYLSLKKCVREAVIALRALRANFSGERECLAICLTALIQ